MRRSECCYECKDREPGCHDRCEKYQGWLKQHIEESRIIRAEKKKLYEANGVEVERAKRKKARYNKKS